MRTRTRTIPGFDDAIASERLRFRTEPQAGDGAGDGGGDGGSEGGGSGAGTATAPPATGNGAGGGDGGGQGGSGGGSEWDEERARRTIERQRESEDQAKAEAKREKERADKLEREKMSDEEKIKADKEAAEQSAAAATTRAHRAELLGRLANRDDIADAEAARAVLLERGLEFDGDGNPVDLDTKLSKLLEDKPFLRKGQGPAPSDDGNGGGGDGGSGSSDGGSGGSNGTGTTPPQANGANGSGGQGSPPQLSQEEVDAANKAGMSAERYASMKEGATLADWQKQKEAEDGDGK